MKQKYIFISSNQDKGYSNINTPYDFTVFFNNNLEFNKRNTVCALAEISFKSKIKEDLIVCSDITETSYFQGNYIPILRNLEAGESTYSFTNLYYIPITQNKISSINIYLITTEGRKPESSIRQTECTLHFVE